MAPLRLVATALALGIAPLVAASFDPHAARPSPAAARPAATRPASAAGSAASGRAAANDNRRPAGSLRDGVLTIRLEAREAEWHPDRDADPGIRVHAFAEEGKQPLVPGPLIRVPEGTEIRAFVHNALSRGALTVRGLSTRGVPGRGGRDTPRILPGATREVRFVAGAPGTYHYSATTDAPPTDSSTPDALLGGAFVVDARGAPPEARDRVFVIALWRRGGAPGAVINRTDLLRFAVNGKAWPNTERLSYAVGDTVRFRIVNASPAVHPMHLHGFYFRVDSRGDGMLDSVYDRAASPQLVVTERVVPGRTFTMTWVPERAGNWMFHCHDNFHVLRNAALDGSPLPAEHSRHVVNHAMEMMGGLVLGVEVRGRDMPRDGVPAADRRRLRLVVAIDTGGTAEEPAYGYALQEGSTSGAAARPRLPGPTILLKRGEPVSIMVVNALPEPTAVHWHGIELESYFDGVAGFSGSNGRLSPAIAPRDSFEARFTPPRAGTFMYHPHADEVRQQQAGLSGALVVVDSPAAFDPTTDVVLLVSTPRRDVDGATVLLNGSAAPPALQLRVGVRYRLRLVDIHTSRPSMIARLLRDSTLVTWRAVAKDGMTLPADRATARPAMQQMGNGETYDFEFTPTAPGDLRFTMSAASGALLASMPVTVR